MIALDVDVGILDARPRLDQRDGRGASLLADGNQEPLAVGRDHHALVEQRVFLQAAVEVVAEGRVRAGRGGQLAVVGLHQAPLADSVLLHLVADRHDAADDFVPRHHRLLARHIALDSREHRLFDAGDHFRLARRGRETA